MKTNLAIFSIAFCFLGGIQCISLDQFRMLQESYVTRNETESATVFVTDNFVTKNRFCFMMLLREIIVSDNIWGYSNYKNPFLMAIYLLNNEMFHTHYDAIYKVLSSLKDWNQINKPNKLVENIKTLIENGEEFNMWYMAKGAVTERDEDSFHLGITKESSYSQTCISMYNSMATGSTLIQNIMEKTLPGAIDARIKLFRSIPYLMYTNEEYQYLLKYTNGEQYFLVDAESGFDFTRATRKLYPVLIPESRLDKDIELQNLLNIIIDFYKMKIISFVHHSFMLLGSVVEQDGHKTFKNKEEAILTYLVITDKIMKCVNSMVLRYNRLRTYSELLATAENNLESDWPKLQEFYAEIRKKVMNGQGSILDETKPSVLKKANNDYEDVNKLDSYPSLLMYYPKYVLMKKNIDNNLSFKRLLNLQAWVALLPSYMDTSITAIESVDRYKPRPKSNA